jgi:predicted DNA-binding protein
MRLPPETVRYLNALSTVLSTPQWRIVHKAIGAMIERLPADDRELVEILFRKSKP